MENLVNPIQAELKKTQTPQISSLNDLENIIKERHLDANEFHKELSELKNYG